MYRIIVQEQRLKVRALSVSGFIRAEIVLDTNLRV
jgi:hypothetical protein